jgi:hypothetical protein
MIDLSYPNLLTIIEPHLAPKRTESASFLIWYFENYLRLDRLDATDAVCDQCGDKGIDGIYLNSDANIIEVYQSKISQKPTATIGDKLLREFQGSLSQFSSVEAIENIVTSAGDADIARLIKRLDLVKHLSEFEVVGYFICNSELDDNGIAFLRATPSIRFIGKNELESSYVGAERNIPASTPVSFSVTGYDVATYIVDTEHSAVIAPVKASELVTMDGIANQAVFAFNVRGPLGQTQVNRDISQSIGDQTKHKLFPLFHNGITVVAEKVTANNDSVDVENYFVVNGCQSLNSLFKNRRNLTDDLRILTKFIQAPPASPLAEMITRFSNNQNGVKARDFKSNNQIQIRLQNEFKAIYGASYFYEIKRGEDSQGIDVISNELAGQYLMAFDLKTPWTTHRKYQVFEEKHSDLFGRPSVTAHRILLYHVLANRVEAAQSQITNILFAKYVLTKFFMLYVLRLLFESDETASELLTSPENFVTNGACRLKLGWAIDKLLAEVVTDLNAEIDQLGEDFDYRGKLRDEIWCKKLGHEIVATHKKLVDRGRLDTFAVIYDSYEQPAATVGQAAAP